MPWRVWLRSLVGLTPTQAAVLQVLVSLADWRGQVVVSVAYLVEASTRPRSSVLRALAQLEADGVIVRRRRRTAGHQGASLVSLVAAPVVDAGGGGEAAPVYVLPDFPRDGPVVALGDDEGLRAAICRAVGEGWVGEGTQVVCRSLVRAAGRQLSTPVSRGQVFSGLGHQESVDDTVSWAWQALREATGPIVAARSPWAHWTVVTGRMVARARDVPLPEQAVDPCAVPTRDSGLPGGLDRPREVGLDELGGPLGAAVAALVGAGMCETLAWAGTRRVAELALRGRSRAHTLAALDPRLEDLGVGPACARAWATLVVGSRRGTRAGLVGLDGQELGARAAEVVAAYGAGAVA